MDVVFMGTPEFSVPTLEGLIAQEGINVLGVVTQPDRRRGRGQQLKPSPVKAKAQAAGLEIMQPKDVNSADSVDKLRSLAPQAMVVVAYGQILSKELLELPPLGCINVHASLLPKYRGPAPLHRVIINSEKQTGVTTIYMDQGLDTGDIILQEEIEIAAEDTVGVVHDRLAKLGAEVLLETLELVARDEAESEPQDDRKATYAQKITKEECLIDWTAEAQQIKDLIRGLNPWPGAYTYHQGQRLKVWESKIYDSKTKPSVVPGTVVNIEVEAGFVVQSGEGQLLITKVQPENKQSMSANDYLRGYDLQTGSILATDRKSSGEQNVDN
ncbi:methionyl-tRNA formyltransferase [Fuchsiella alkaliacetigena]|uniref:methionyl-tRNA formyltransferase n=1 Tax=Fuchsiella alkaliacetigena TaxID=957042 RepID=UPI00200A8171|nr:methionyl-tRNA formyltransferase [Fuchsiella alkaliacetigena]MCK8823619.1 methionyl-tRNA formyltransferase [Fuchsiella alkaliacetigena]